MVDISAKRFDDLFYALSDKTRRQMLMLLTKESHTVTELVEPFQLSKQAISKHLKVLESAGLISKQKRGRIQHCEFNAKAMQDVQKIVDQYWKFWDQQLTGLDEYIQNKQKEKMNAKSSKR